MSRLQVKWRGGFSDRNNLIDINKTIQIEDFDKETRNALFNIIARIFEIVKQYSKNQSFIEYIYTKVFNKKVSEIPREYCSTQYSLNSALSDIEAIIEYNSYHEILTLIEAIVCTYINFINSNHNDKLQDSFNQIFEEYCVGYRFINNQISPIIDKTEIEAIKDAINFNDKFANASKHIQKALEYLSDRENKDYKSSVHESICAIEATVNTILGSKEPLNKALKEFEKKRIPDSSFIKNCF